MTEQNKSFGGIKKNLNKKGCFHYPYVRLEIKITDSRSKVFLAIKNNIQSDKHFKLIKENDDSLKIKWKSPSLQWKDMITIKKGGDDSSIIIVSKVLYISNSVQI
jgi:hypothetical protein